MPAMMASGATTVNAAASAPTIWLSVVDEVRYRMTPNAHGPSSAVVATTQPSRIELRPRGRRPDMSGRVRRAGVRVAHVVDAVVEVRDHVDHAGQTGHQLLDDRQ